MRTLSFLAFALALSACGTDTNNQIEVLSDSGGPAGQLPGTDTATQAQGTAEAKGINCSAYPAATHGKLDVVGITLGMAAEQAFNTLACAYPKETVEYSTTGGFKVPQVPDALRPRMFVSVSAGLDEVSVFLVGQRGQETVAAIMRKTEMEQGKEPPAAGLLQSLVGKYGEGNITQPFSTPLHHVTYSPSGQRLGPDNEDFNTCAGDPISFGMSVDSRCGLTVNYAVGPLDRNPGLARAMYVQLVDQASAMQAIEAYTAYAKGVIANQKAEEVRRADEAVQQAGKDGRMPSL